MELTIKEALQQGVTAHKIGNLKKAERLYRFILKSQPLHPDANHNLGLLEVSMNKADSALPLLKIALERNPKVEQFWVSYIDALIKENKFSAAKKLIIKAESIGIIKDKLGALSERLTSETINKTPTLSALNRLLEHYKNKRYCDAEMLAVTLSHEFPKHPFSWKVLGAVFSQTGRKNEAVNARQKVIALSAQDAEAHYDLGNALKRLGRLAKAEASYMKAIALKPKHALAHNNLGNTLRELGRLEQSEISLRKAIALKPDYAFAHSNLGNTLREMGRLEQSEISLRKAIALKPEYAEAYNNLGNTLRELGKLDEAEECYKKAIDFKHEFKIANVGLGSVLMLKGKYKDGLD